jgi:hypothetical protein
VYDRCPVYEIVGLDAQADRIRVRDCNKERRPLNDYAALRLRFCRVAGEPSDSFCFSMADVPCPNFEMLKEFVSLGVTKEWIYLLGRNCEHNRFRDSDSKLTLVSVDSACHDCERGERCRFAFRQHCKWRGCGVSSLSTFHLLQISKFNGVDVQNIALRMCTYKHQQHARNTREDLANCLLIGEHYSVASCSCLRRKDNCFSVARVYNGGAIQAGPETSWNVTSE